MDLSKMGAQALLALHSLIAGPDSDRHMKMTRCETDL